MWHIMKTKVRRCASGSWPIDCDVTYCDVTSCPVDMRRPYENTDGDK